MPVRFLIADDMPAQQKLLANAVLFLGGESRFAPNGIEALRLAREEHFDMVLMDLRMPELGGVAAASMLLDHWRDMTLRPRILVISGEAPEDTYPLCRAIGVDGFVGKPYTMTALKRSLMMLLTQGHSWMEGPARRLLDITKLSRSMDGRDEVSLMKECDEARLMLHTLRAAGDGPALRSQSGMVALLSLFSRRHGFLELQSVLDQLATAIGTGSSYTELMPESWEEVQENFEFACRAAVAWYRQPQLSESLAA